MFRWTIRSPGGPGGRKLQVDSSKQIDDSGEVYTDEFEEVDGRKKLSDNGGSEQYPQNHSLFVLDNRS